MKILILIFLFLGYLVINIKKNVHILQQNFYNENNRYLKWGINNILNVFNIVDIVLCLFNLCNLIFRYEYLMLVNIIYFGLFIYCYSKLKKEQVKIPLRVTSRVKRLFFTCFIIYIIPLIIYIFNGDVYLVIFIYSILISFNFFVISLVNIINIPAEKLVYYYYRTKAIKKLRKNINTCVIGITGSYGKTSSKNILYEILSLKFNVLMTPKNFNTQYGLIITINSYLDKFDEVFIAEMGAFKVGSINKLCKLVKPRYGIITNIGVQHLETFHSRENIQKGKFELVEALPSDGVAILNMDDVYQVNYNIKNDCQIIWIGIDNTLAHVRASDIIMDENGMKFHVIFKGDTNKYNFETRLLGYANIYNILSAIALGKYMGMNIYELQLGVKKIKPIAHRLEIKKINDIVVIDDAYNSNPVGSKMAIDVLNLMPGCKIVVSPGMVELGKVEDEFNKIFGKYMSKVANYVILVGRKQTKFVYEGLIEEEYDEERIFIINDVKEAFKIIDNIKVGQTKYVLLENDLPDIFNEN